MPADVDLHFPFLPNALGAYLWDTVASAMGGAQFAQRMQTDRSFRSAVRFLLTEYDQDVRQTIDLVKEVTTWQTPEGIAFWRDILREPALHNVVQFHLTFALLDVVRRGRVSITNAYVAGEWTLRVPPSYDDYNHQMRRIYAKAYLYMVSANKHNELRLSRLAEQLYCYLPHEQYYQANLMGYALVHAGGIVDKGRLDAVVAQNGWDAELMMRYVDLVRQALKNK